MRGQGKTALLGHVIHVKQAVTGCTTPVTASGRNFAAEISFKTYQREGRAGGSEALPTRSHGNGSSTPRNARELHAVV